MWFGINWRTCKLALKETRPPFNAIKHDSEGKKSVYWVNNIGRFGEKTLWVYNNHVSYKVKVYYFCQISGMELGASLHGGEFECARVNSIPFHMTLPFWFCAVYVAVWLSVCLSVLLWAKLCLPSSFQSLILSFIKSSQILPLAALKTQESVAF